MTIFRLRHILSRWLAVFAVIAFSLQLSFAQASSDSNETVKQYRFLPDYVKLQYAGGIGFLSAGVGYSFFDYRLDVSFFYGYTPVWFTVDDLHSISLQFTAKFIRIKTNRNIEILPLNFGWYIHHTFGKEYWVVLPNNYPKGYYWWPPGINAGVFLGGEIKTKLLANQTPASGLAFYVRVGTRVLYLSSKVGNSSIPVTDIIELGFGVAFYR
jgi:hypothetical protein